MQQALTKLTQSNQELIKKLEKDIEDMPNQIFKDLEKGAESSNQASSSSSSK
ncbi:hypothetical protein [Mycoplasma suis]|uniref:hypothetical protein n=1 Tax=Mycoplasma suis TaxID=57372 RepID=UPI0002F4FD04|nr:hypothetical protein [Mycoplasma suis]